MKQFPFRVVAFVVFCLVMAGGAWWFANWFDNLPGRAELVAKRAMLDEAREIRDKFLAMADFQPQIRVNDRVVFEKKSTISEVAVLSRTAEINRDWEHTWAGSTKRLHLHGKYAVKSGFALDDHFEVTINAAGAHVQLPPARILSVEPLDIDFQTEDGWWNTVTDAERKEALAEMQKMAREQSVDLNQEAERTFRDRLTALLGPTVTVAVAPAPEDHSPDNNLPVDGAHPR